jgi:hypothetical protein
MFTAPQNTPGTSTPYIATYHVYGEDEFMLDSHVAVAPFIYLLSNRVPPRKTKLPLIMLDLPDFPSGAFEIGNRLGGVQVVSFNIFARNRGERDDLAGYIRQVLIDYPSIQMKNYTATTPANTYTTFAEAINITKQTIAPDLGTEGALQNWVNLSFELQIRE